MNNSFLKLVLLGKETGKVHKNKAENLLVKTLIYIKFSVLFLRICAIIIS